MDINKYIKECHEAAIEKGFYDCPECVGKGVFFLNSGGFDMEGENVEPPDRERCEYCNGTGITKNRNIGEMLELVNTELSEMTKAHRNNRFSTNKTAHDNIINGALKAIEKVKDKRLDIEGFINYFENAIKDTFEDEIADVFIRLFNLCGYLKISDLEISSRMCTNPKNIAQYIFHLRKTLWDIYLYYERKSIYIKNAIENTFGYLLWFCKYLKIDYEKHIIAKMEYNKTRPFKHNKEY